MRDMELVAIDDTRIIYLLQLHRPTGQIFLPEAIAKLIARYSFAKFPPLEELSLRRDFNSFEMGKFQNVQIQELRIYGDGIIVSSRSNSKILDAFVDDLFSWSAKELGLVPVVISKPEKYYESSLVVKSSNDLTAVMGMKSDVAASLNQLLSKSNYKARLFKPSGFLMDCDVHEQGGQRKPMKFVLERRLSVPFEENVFFSQAPLPTDDHLIFLETIERLAR